jgi:hypothetical protein
MSPNNLSIKERQDISFALHGWANYIETGDICIGAQDAYNMHQPNRVKRLSEEQQDKVKGIRSLAIKVLT